MRWTNQILYETWINVLDVINPRTCSTPNSMRADRRVDDGMTVYQLYRLGRILDLTDTLGLGVWDLEGVGATVVGVVDADAVHREEQRLGDAVLDNRDTVCRSLTGVGVGFRCGVVGWYMGG